MGAGLLFRKNKSLLSFSDYFASSSTINASGDGFCFPLYTTFSRFARERKESPETLGFNPVGRVRLQIRVAWSKERTWSWPGLICISPCLQYLIISYLCSGNPKSGSWRSYCIHLICPTGALISRKRCCMPRFLWVRRIHLVFCKRPMEIQPVEFLNSPTVCRFLQSMDSIILCGARFC